jgi:uncharacterized protein YlxW (UPF0749 family)
LSPITRRHYTVFTLFMVMVGLLAATAYRANVSSSPAAPVGDRHEELVQLVQSLEGRKASLKSDLAKLRGQVSDLGEAAAQRQGLREGYTAELDRMSMLAGLVPVKGSGLVVTLADNPDPPANATDPNNYIVHDYDLRALVNALWAGGAEAASVNDQRLVASSAIRCVGTTILVNNTRLGSPFVVKAIGDRAKLRRALDSDRNAHLLIAQYARLFGLKLDVEGRDKVELPAYGGSLAPRELHLPDKGGS